MVNSMALAGVTMGCCSTDLVEQVTLVAFPFTIITNIIITTVTTTTTTITTIITTTITTTTNATFAYILWQNYHNFKFLLKTYFGQILLKFNDLGHFSTAKTMSYSKMSKILEFG